MDKIDIEKIKKNRIPIKEVFSSKKPLAEVLGWVDNIRELGKIRFIVLKDSSGLIQVTAIESKTQKEIFKKISKITRESVVYVSGKIVSSKQAPGGKEINPESLEIISHAEELPIDVSENSKTELPKRLDYRFLDLHRSRTRAMFRIKSEIANSFRGFFSSRGFMEVFLPSVISSSSEGGTELFEAKYFEKKAYLAQSPQLYKQMVATTPIEKVFTITPVWRAEKHNTVRHLNESRQMDIEMAFANQFIVMKELEEVIKFIIKKIIENCKDELETLGVKLKVPKAVYLSYEEAIKKVAGKIGDDFSPSQEKKLCDMHKGDIVFTHSWPANLKPFYIMPKDADASSKISEGFDALYLGSEVSSGGQRIHIPELLEKMLKSKGLNPKDFKSYIDSFRYGAPPHGGWSIGLERFTQNLLGVENIREVVLFPRDRDRLGP